MDTPTFRVKPYAHRKYKFVVRAKLEGKWKRSYFETEKDAVAYARKQNAVCEEPRATVSTSPGRGALPRSISPGQAARNAVVILGMHRSGTSALAGALNIAGVNFGRHLVPPAVDNEKGYWEHPDIVTLHDELLRLLNSGWKDDAPLPPKWESSETAQEIQSLLLRVLERDFSASALFGLKDPRMCRLMPLWFPIFEKLGVQPHFVLTARHPWEVAQSLVKRDNLDPARSYLLWLEHVLEAEAATRSFPRSFVSYDALLEDPVAALARLQRELGLRLSVTPEARVSLSKFLEGSLRHHRSHAGKKMADEVPALARELYAVISRKSPSAEISQEILNFANRFAEGSALFLPRINLLEAEIANLDRQIPGQDDAGRESLVRLEIFHPRAQGYSEEHLEARYFNGGSWKLLTIDLPVSAETTDRTVRIDPTSYPAVIDIGDIALKRVATGEVLWSATSENEFAEFEVAGTACRLSHERYLRILSFGADPQLFLPASTASFLKARTRLELSILVDNRPDSISKSVTAMQKQAEWKGRIAATPFLVVYADRGNGFIEEESLRAPLQMDVIQTVRFDDFETFCTTDTVRLRIDPIDRAAAISLASIRIIRNSDDFVLYAVDSAQTFEAMGLSEGLTGYLSGHNLLLLATSSDPQLHLHLPLPGKTAGTSSRLEITLEPQSGSSGVLERCRHAFQERDTLALELKTSTAELERLESVSKAWKKTCLDLKASLETTQAENGRLAAQAQASAAEISQLRGLIEQERVPSHEVEAARARYREREEEASAARQTINSLHLEIASLHDLMAESRGQATQLLADLESERAQNDERRIQIEANEHQLRVNETEIRRLQDALDERRTETRRLLTELQNERTENVAKFRALTQQQEAIQNDLREVSKALEQSRGETARVTDVLAIRAAEAGGLRAYNARLEHRLANTATELRAAGKSLRDKNVDSPVACDLILADIDRIAKPPFFWKLAEALGLVRLMRRGLPRSPAERRAIARELKEGLHEIRKALGSGTTAPEDLASNISRLFDLRRRTHEVANSLKVWKAFRLRSPVWNFMHWARRAPGHLSGAQPAAVLFDPAWYLSRYPDVAASDFDPLAHYLTWGVQDKRNPNPLFDTSWYLAANPDVAEAGLNPLEHYVTAGASEGRDPCPLFSTSWYLSENPDVAAAGVNPLQHYFRNGIAERRNPHPVFDCAYYLEHNPEAEGLNPVEHYLNVGASRGASPHPLFDAAWYLEQYADVAATKLDPLLHYLETGWREGRIPHPLFDSSWYLDRNADVREQGVNPLVHYLTAGSQEGRDPHPLVDSSWYKSKNAAALPPGCDPLVHYLRSGARGNLDPNPLFDTSWYLEENVDVAAAEVNPLVHFSIAGGPEGRDPHPLFDSSWYFESYPDVRQSGMNPLSHYLSIGASQGRDPHPLFQTKYYQEQKRAHEFSAAELEASLETAKRARPARRKSTAGVVYAFTSICLNYVPKAIVLARTLKQHNPDIHFCVLVSDRIPEGALDSIDVFDEVVSLADLDIPNKPSWIFRHSVVELCTAVKGYFMVDLIEREDCAAAFYFDPDIVCFSALDLLKDNLEKASILLTPHLTDPEVTTEAILDNEICALKHGVYNLGFLGLRPSPEGRRFARWWRDRLRDFCRADIPGGLFTDQRWVDLAPALFQEVDIVRHPGCNAATWNLTNRNIEGDFSTGFTVNGQPLIFYHFSGFDSGAQGAMLDKYGGEMPAAQLLRKWYVQETTQSGDAHFSQFPWTLASFSNGEAISEAHRLLYRDRSDLQKAFPNPFDATNPGASYYHWYHSEVLGRPLLQEASDYNPLIEFMESQPPLSPNPFFDSHWYLQRNPDVAAAQWNPLIHFVLAGADEGRQPNPTFYPAYYRQQLPPSERLENPLTHYVIRGRKEDRRTDPRFDPVTDAPLRDRICSWAKAGPPLILIVSHYGGGGTEKHLRDLINSVEGRARFIQLTPGHDGFVRLFARSEEISSSLVFDPENQFQELVEVLQECEPRRIHIHHILGNEEYLAALVRELNLPFDFTIHDYYVLAPSPHLVGRNARFVGDNLSAHEEELLAVSIAPRRPTSLAAWQDAHDWLVTDADRVIAPSRDVARRLARFFPARQLIVAAHPEVSQPRSEVIVPSLTGDDHLRVVVLGDYLPHKGADILLECARTALKNNAKVQFQLIGDAHSHSRVLEDARVWLSGRYEEEDVQALLARREPHLIWYPALCPESYSYTLSIGLESGLPLAVTNLGSLPERVAGRPWTWICPWQNSAGHWLSFFLRIRQDNFLKKTGPATPAGGKPVTSSFYRNEYLAALSAGEPALDSQSKRTGSLAVTR